MTYIQGWRECITDGWNRSMYNKNRTIILYFNINRLKYNKNIKIEQNPCIKNLLQKNSHDPRACPLPFTSITRLVQRWHELERYMMPMGLLIREITRRRLNRRKDRSECGHTVLITQGVFDRGNINIYILVYRLILPTVLMYKYYYTYQKVSMGDYKRKASFS